MGRCIISDQNEHNITGISAILETHNWSSLTLPKLLLISNEMPQLLPLLGTDAMDNENDKYTKDIYLRKMRNCLTNFCSYITSVTYWTIWKKTREVKIFLIKQKRQWRKEVHHLWILLNGTKELECRWCKIWNTDWQNYLPTSQFVKSTFYCWRVEFIIWPK